jgi:integrating conjugative element protein (TIGR03765 family)
LGLRVVNRARVDFKFPVARPLCVLGSDSYSKRWLMLNAEILVRSGALCYVIEAQTPAAVDAVRRLAPKVPMAGIADAVFVAAGLRGYPALIDRTGVVK